MKNGSTNVVCHVQEKNLEVIILPVIEEFGRRHVGQVLTGNWMTMFVKLVEFEMYKFDCIWFIINLLLFVSNNVKYYLFELKLILCNEKL